MQIVERLWLQALRRARSPARPAVRARPASAPPAPPTQSCSMFPALPARDNLHWRHQNRRCRQPAARAPPRLRCPVMLANSRSLSKSTLPPQGLAHPQSRARRASQRLRRARTKSRRRANSRRPSPPCASGIRAGQAALFSPAVIPLPEIGRHPCRYRRSTRRLLAARSARNGWSRRSFRCCRSATLRAVGASTPPSFAPTPRSTADASRAPRTNSPCGGAPSATSTGELERRRRVAELETAPR
mmetsp:Transcript_41087/g.118157  ORF Transcript_41087/g.118157 Transcript_41087/m.118157 type:complete len:244 (-) Transcript_41087:1903-2634(-)